MSTMTLDDILRDSPTLHQDETGRPISYGLSTDVLEFLDHRVDRSSVTLETGAGLSTILFALKGATHICIVPDPQEVARIKQYCREHAIPIDGVTFVVESSEHALPRLRVTDLDLVLIDGRHGFPVPFIDWFYTAPRLKLGGLVIIDDLQLWTCSVLQEFLEAEPEWKLTERLSRSAVFAKLKEGSELKEWNDQSYTVRNSRT